MRYKIWFEFDAIRWKFFGDNQLGIRVCDIVGKLNNKFPNNKFIHKIWLFCLPF